MCRRLNYLIFTLAIVLAANVTDAREIWREAEAADSITAPMVIRDDATNSGGQHIGVPSGGSSNANPTTGIATYTFTAPAGVYKMICRVWKNGGSDSFWINISDSTSPQISRSDGWARWNGIGESQKWVWDDVHEADPGDPIVHFTLSGGTHTLQIARREQRTYMDAFLITDDLDLDPATLPDDISGQVDNLEFDTAVILYPVKKATDVPREVVLSWTPGAWADKHDVYFGTSLDEVANAANLGPMGADNIYRVRQDDDSYAVPEILDFEQTYYWRIDEVNAPPTSDVVVKGDIWSFTVEPVACPIDSGSITATASSNNLPGQEPDNVVNGSGLDDNDLHSSEGTDMWLSGTEADGAWIQFEFERVQKLHQMLVWNHNTELEAAIGFGINEASVEYSLDGSDWTVLGTVHEFARASGLPGYAADTTIDLGGVAAKFVKITANSNWGGILQQYGLSEVRFSAIPILAREPNPASGASNVAPDVTLGWRAGRDAALHEVYLGTDPDALALAGSTVEASFAAASQGLALGQHYYWLIDEVNDAETPTVWEGELWEFSTPEYLVVDDFESYNDIAAGEEGSNLVYLMWTDGFENPSANGSAIGYVEAFQPSMETDIVYGGVQSVPLMYDNSVAASSEVTVDPANLSIGRDWTKGSPQTLVLHFYGDPGNIGGQLYVKINNVKEFFDGNPVAISRPFWTQWNVELDAVGTDLARVNSVTIGIEGAGARGVLYVDELRLYGQAPQELIPQDPGTDNLVAYYAMDNNAQDGSGHGHHGTPVGAPIYAPGIVGMAMDFDAIDDRVDLGSLDVAGGGITLSLWLNPESYLYDDTRVLSKAVNTGENDHWWMMSTDASQHRLRFRLKTNDGQDTTTLRDKGGVPIGEWTHAAATWDGSTMRVYQNLALVASTAKGGTAVAVDASVSAAIGNQPEGAGDKHWDGLIDEVRIYNRGLSEVELLHVALSQ